MLLHLEVKTLTPHQLKKLENLIHWKKLKEIVVVMKEFSMLMTF